MYKIGKEKFELTTFCLANANKCMDFVEGAAEAISEGGKLGIYVIENEDKVLRFLAAVLVPKGEKWSPEIYQRNLKYFQNVEIPLQLVLKVVIDFFTNNKGLLIRLKYPQILANLMDTVIETLKLVMEKLTKEVERVK